MVGEYFLSIEIDICEIMKNRYPGDIPQHKYISPLTLITTKYSLNNLNYYLSQFHFSLIHSVFLPVYKVEGVLKYRLPPFPPSVSRPPAAGLCLSFLGWSFSLPSSPTSATHWQPCLNMGEQRRAVRWLPRLYRCCPGNVETFRCPTTSQCLW